MRCDPNKHPIPSKKVVDYETISHFPKFIYRSYKA